MSYLTDLRAALRRQRFVVLDTETTGLEHPAEICQIAIIDTFGQVLLDTLVKPSIPIPAAAFNIHGISDEAVHDAPLWFDVRPLVLQAISGLDVIVYNATYDRRMMRWTDKAWLDNHIDYEADANWWCAMEAYAEYHGEKHPYYGSFVWQRLTNAMAQCSLPIDGAHNALGDCRMTLSLCRYMERKLAERDIMSSTGELPGMPRSYDER